MLVICAVILLAIGMSLLSSGEGRPSVIMCNSVSCSNNKLCRCERKEIAVYDNTVKGLCLYHTENMKDRILEPMKKGGLLEEVYVTAGKLAKTKRDIQDEDVLKNPVAFARWMYRHGMGR